RLVWDRLPLAVTLMGLFAATISERLSLRAGLILLPLLSALALASVLQWYVGEVHGRGDLRLYGVVQFYPMLAIPLLLLLRGPRYTGGGWLLAALGLYALAKLFEALDVAIFDLGHAVSGHTLKHVAAALAGCAVWRMLLTRHPLPGGQS
ncbi:MAG TPA: alkaline phytoceramidase, partial [Methylomirabilota bacterium]|nr:alkaline phytoceramidase [Methylomirabilota bacterium]